jgi:hypothetical protein
MNFLLCECFTWNLCMENLGLKIEYEAYNSKITIFARIIIFLCTLWWSRESLKIQNIF